MLTFRSFSEAMKMIIKLFIAWLTWVDWKKPIEAGSIIHAVAIRGVSRAAEPPPPTERKKLKFSSRRRRLPMSFLAAAADREKKIEIFQPPPPITYEFLSSRRRRTKKIENFQPPAPRKTSAYTSSCNWFFSPLLEQDAFKHSFQQRKRNQFRRKLLL